MAKFYGSSVKTGRVGGSVFSVRNGVTIERQYQPTVFNPSTPAQIASRAVFKLMSQLAEVLAPILGFRREGLTTVRNLFTRANFRLGSYDPTSAIASVVMTSLRLTSSVLGIAPLAPTRAEGSVTLQLQSAATDYDAVAYGLVRVLADGSFRLVYSNVIDTPGADGRFVTDAISFASNATGYAYAYGIRFNNDNARALYNDVRSQGENAILDVVRRSNQNDVSVSETVAAQISTFA